MLLSSPKANRFGKMVSIRESKMVDAKIDRVWEIVSDVDKDPEYWTSITSISNIKKDMNLIERKVKVGLIGKTSWQTIRLVPKRSVELTMTKGPIIGTREISLSPLSSEKTEFEVLWEFEASGVPSFARSFVAERIKQGTKEALEKIATNASAARRKTVKKFEHV